MNESLDNKDKPKLDKNQIRSFLKQAIESKKELELESKKLNETIETKEMRIKMLENILNETVSDKNNILKKLREQISMNDELEAKFEEAQENIQRLNQHITELQKRNTQELADINDRDNSTKETKPYIEIEEDIDKRLAYEEYSRSFTLENMLKERDAQILAMENSKEDLQNQITNLQEQVDEKNQEIAKIVACATRSYDTSNLDNNQLSQKLTELASALSIAQAKLELGATKYSDKEKKMISIQSQLLIMKQELSNAQEDNQSKDQIIRYLQNKLQNKAEMENYLLYKLEEIQIQEEINQRLSSQIEQLEIQLNEEKERYEEITFENDINNSAETIAKENQELKQKIEETKRQLIQSQEEKLKYEKEIENISQQSEKLKASLTYISEENERILNELKGKKEEEKEIVTVKESIKNKEVLIERLKSQLQNMEGKLILLQNEKNSYERENKQFKVKNNDLSKELESKQSYLIEIEQQIQKSQQSLQYYYNLSHQQENKIQQLEASLVEYDSKERNSNVLIADLRNNIDNFQKEIRTFNENKIENDSIKNEHENKILQLNLSMNFEKISRPVKYVATETSEDIQISYLQRLMLQFFIQDTSAQEKLIPIILQIVGCEPNQIIQAQKSWINKKKTKTFGFFG